MQQIAFFQSLFFSLVKRAKLAFTKKLGFLRKNLHFKLRENTLSLRRYEPSLTTVINLHKGMLFHMFIFYPICISPFRWISELCLYGDLEVGMIIIVIEEKVGNFIN